MVSMALLAKALGAESKRGRASAVASRAHDGITDAFSRMINQFHTLNGRGRTAVITGTALAAPNRLHSDV